jgi:uncharacterized protein involved in outer membrane biogenesis
VLRSPLQNAMQKTAGVPVQFTGRFDASLLWGPRLDVERITVGAGGGLPAPHLFDGRNVVLEWSWGALWRWRRGETLRLRTLQADTLDLQLLRAADGRATWQLGRGQKQPKRDDERDDLPRVGLLAVNDGRIVVDDRVTETQLQIALQVREQEGAATQRGSGYRATVSGRYRAMPLKLQPTAHCRCCKTPKTTRSIPAAAW